MKTITLFLLASACSACVASAENVTVVRAPGAPTRAPVAAEHVRIVADTTVPAECTAIGYVSLDVAVPTQATGARFDALTNLKKAAATLGADEVHDVHFEPFFDRYSRTTVRGVATSCAR